MGGTILTFALAVGGLLLASGIAPGTRFLGPDFYRNTVQPLQAALHAVRDEMPLDPETVHAL